MDDSQERLLQEIADTLQKVRGLLTPKQPEQQVYFASSTKGFPIDYKERRYVFFWVPNNSLILSFEDYGTISIPANTWVNIAYPQGINILAPNNTSNTPVFVRCVDEVIQSPVLSTIAFQGSIAAASTNAAALTSSTDYSFTWGPSGTTQVNHVLLQNNTSSNLNFGIDATASAGSFLLSPGQTISLDIQMKTLHLFQAGTPNVNGTSGGNIVVVGWL